MQTTKKSFKALGLVVCLMVALLGGSAVAWAADSGTGGNSLTAHAIDPSSKDKDMVSDIATANVQVDVYQVATYDASTDKYTVDGTQFKDSDLSSYLEKAQADSSKAEEYLKSFSDRAADIVFKVNGIKSVKSNVPVDEALTGLDNGIFLVIPHGKGVTPKSKDQMTAKGKKYSYKYLASVVPLKSGTDQESVTINLKPEKTKTPTPENPPSNPPTKNVKTGDSWNLLPFYAIMIISGVALIALVVSSARRRKRDQ